MSKYLSFFKYVIPVSLLVLGALIGLPNINKAEAAGTFTVALSPALRTINAGLTTTYTVDITRQGGFNSAITLTQIQCPSGVTCSFNSSTNVTSLSIPAGSGSVTKTLYVRNTNGMTPGNYSVAVRGTGSSQTSEDYATLQLTIPGGGSITRYYWNYLDQSRSMTPSVLFNSGYPNSPSQTTYPTTFEAPTNLGETYGTRMIGYLYPPRTGQYTFWIASNDHAWLYLSSSDNPFYKVKIARENNTSGVREWTSSNQSSPVTLQAGQKYFIEAVQDEFTGSDNLAVGWRMPGSSVTEVIPGTYLSIWNGASQCPFQSQTGRTIVNLQGTDYVGLISDWEKYSTFTVPASLSAGNYKVTLASWHEDTDAQAQKQYYLSLLNSSGSQIVQTSPIVAMTPSAFYKTEVVNDNLSVTSNVASIKAVHSAFPTQPVNPNTVHAVCAAFDVVNNPISVSLSADPVTVTSPTTATTLTWTTTGSPTSCSATASPSSSQWTGSKSATGGTQSITGLTSAGTYTYTITCSKSGSDDQISSVNVSVESTGSKNLFINKSGAGSGTVTSSPSGINCGSDCGQSYSNNTSVTLTATPASGSEFAGWSAASCPGTGTCTVSMTQNRTITATFNESSPTQYPLNVIRSGQGIVDSDLPGIDCGTTCQALYDEGTIVNLSATPGNGRIFTGWGGVCTGRGICRVTIGSSSNTVIANFAVDPNYKEF